MLDLSSSPRISDDVTVISDDVTVTSKPHDFGLPKLKGFIIASLNIGSLVKHVDQLRVSMKNQTVDILAVNETRLDNTIDDSEIAISNYTLTRRDRSRHGGGVAIYIRNPIQFKIRNDLKDDDLELLCIEINKPKMKPFLISTWYRPPNAPIELFEKFNCILNKIESSHLESTITGDFNCNILADVSDNNTKHLIELCDLCQYSQLITQPTRITASSSTLIDLILTNEPDKFVTSGVQHIGISDHSLIYTTRKHLSIPKQSPKSSLLVNLSDSIPLASNGI